MIHIDFTSIPPSRFKRRTRFLSRKIYYEVVYEFRFRIASSTAMPEIELWFQEENFSRLPYLQVEWLRDWEQVIRACEMSNLADTENLRAIQLTEQG